MLKKLFAACLCVSALGAVALYFLVFPPIKATHPALTGAELPGVVPLRAFYADPDAKWRFRLSPDGARIAWLEAKRLKPALWVKELGADDDAEVYHTPDVVRWYEWSADGRYLLYQADRDGWENDQIVSVDVTQPGSTPRTYDFGKNVKSWIEYVPPEGGADILISHNARDETRFDLYRLNLDSGETEPLDIISDRWTDWRFTRDGTVFARVTSREGKSWIAELRGQGGTWQQIAAGGLEDQFYIHSEPDEDGTLLISSNLGRDKMQFLRRDLESGTDEVLHSSDTVDTGWAVLHPVTRAPLMALAYPGRQERIFFDPEMERIVAALPGAAEGAVHFVSSTRDLSHMIWEVESDTAGWASYLIETATGTTTLLKRAGVAAYQNDLSEMHPVQFPARDGLTLHALLTRPKGVEGPAPLVIMIHGGPVARTVWGWNGITQWLINRGYAVLDVNYRGSSGYGRAFRKALYGEVSRAEHDDIVDARAWAVAQGIADPDRVAVFGGSWGGLKVLTALTRDPDLFAAGVNINGVADLESLLAEMPPYWTDHLFEALLGPLDDPETRQEMTNRSPVHDLDAVTAPLLTIQGSNDVRVLKNQSDRVHQALTAQGKPSEYMVIDGAGHTFANMTWQQKMQMHRRIERFLARHLGGRADGFDYGVLGAHIIPD